MCQWHDLDCQTHQDHASQCRVHWPYPFAMLVVLSRSRGPRPRPAMYRWRTHWKSAHAHCCYYPKILMQIVPLKCCCTRGCWPIQGKGTEPASGGLDEISCGSFGLSKNRRCSWGNHWKLEATPPQTQPTLVHCCLRLLWARKHWSNSHV